MTQSSNTLVAAADYADALIVARRVKTTLCMLLFFLLGTTVTLFALLRYVPSMAPAIGTGPFDGNTTLVRGGLQYFIGLLDFAGLILPALLVAFVVVILLVQVVARVVGAGRTTSALVWAVLLALLLFPWQAVLNNPATNPDPAADAIGMKVPGVVYTWAELSSPTAGARFPEVNSPPPPGTTVGSARAVAVLHWLRYAGFPLLAMIIVGIIHTKAERALRQSFGTDVIVLPPTADEGTVAATTPLV